MSEDQDQPKGEQPDPSEGHGSTDPTQQWQQPPTQAQPYDYSQGTYNPHGVGGQPPYGQQPGYDQPGYGQQGYDQSGYGQQPYPAASGYQQPGGQYPATNPYAQPRPAGSSDANVSAIILTVLSGLATVSCYCTLIGIAPLIFGILGIVKQGTDPAGAAKMTKIGWIVFAVLTVLAIIAAIVFFIWVGQQESGSSYDGGYETYSFTL
ncbi:hypothetical protein GCM10022199_10550 [Marihabitans asiaticum]|uniref:DUF4190 domain-containing protein n=1 Tax=Marihabitans asiaticum TaxID=415218 RepID=A0A560WHD8_9MICO|nr:hypothetical protein [Marihabitans asiaticum]TWD17072.1 hypothetical protein FB557_0630 [Marihabitans asiaticum]